MSVKPPGANDLRIAICRKDVTSVTSLLKAGADASLLHSRRTPLSWAQEVGDVRLVVVLIGAGADVNRRSCDALERVEPPLITAIRLGQTEIFAALLSAGASCDCVDFYDKSPLWMSVWHRRQEMTAALLAAGAQADVGASNWQLCPLYLASRQPSGSWRQVAFLLALLGAPVDRPDPDGRCCLWWSLKCGDDRLSRLLVALGARLSSPPPQEVDEDIVAASRNVKSLLETCRVRIRKLMGVSGVELPRNIGKLPLPETMIAFLRMQEFGGLAPQSAWPD